MLPQRMRDPFQSLGSQANTFPVVFYLLTSNDISTTIISNTSSSALAYSLNAACNIKCNNNLQVGGSFSSPFCKLLLPISPGSQTTSILPTPIHSSTRPPASQPYPVYPSIHTSSNPVQPLLPDNYPCNFPSNTLPDSSYICHNLKSALTDSNSQCLVSQIIRRRVYD